MCENAKQLISVIVPIYKMEPNLQQCVGSILAQTHRNMEVIWLRGLFKLPLPYYRILRALTFKLGIKSNHMRMLERKGA